MTVTRKFMSLANLEFESLVSFPYFEPTNGLFLYYIVNNNTNFLYLLANCPAGSYYNSENDTCVECPLGTYQPLQGKNECISCGKNLTTAFSATLEESNCIGNVTNNF